jgi:gliding motility-associated-like protein
VNDAPVAYADSVLLTDVQASTVVDVTANDKDVENDVLTITSVSGGSIVAGNIVTKDGKQQIEVAKINTEACGKDSLQYIICDGGGLCATSVLYVEVLCDFKSLMPQGFSPNGDGINDNFVFPGLQYYRPFQFEVYNRWGHPVYTNEDYNNDWNGYAQDLNQPLPDGTYYYIVRLSDGREIVNYCIINR